MIFLIFNDNSCNDQVLYLHLAILSNKKDASFDDRLISSNYSCQSHVLKFFCCLKFNVP